MLNYIGKLAIFIIFSFFIAYSYYSVNPAHIENFDGYAFYVIIILIIYGIYKYIQLGDGNKKEVIFTPLSILGFFLLHLLILCFIFFSLNDQVLVGGIILFFKIIGYSLLPISIILISLAFGKKVISYVKQVDNQSNIFKFLLSLSFGFFSFVTLIVIFGILGFYNLLVVSIILIGFVWFARNELLQILKNIYSYKIVFNIEEGVYLKLLSTEFLFIVATLILSTNLISIVRPFPIGWDDLGTYMNYPHLLAEAGNLSFLGGMYAWQSFTGIGYMFGSPTQAFFINNVGGFLSFIVLVLITSDLLKSTKKSFLNIPMLVGTMFIAMPMVVFQQAKDMKLDTGLFFISIISIYLLYKYFISFKDDNEKKGIGIKFINKITSIFSGKASNNYVVLLIIGVLVGFAFSIKFTTLLLISAMIGIIFYARLGYIAFLGYLAIFFAIFTIEELWSMMNVVVNPDKIAGFEINFFILSFIIGIGLILFSIFKNKGVFKILFIELVIFLLGIGLALFPWLIKNIYTAFPNISISSIINGKAKSFDFSLDKVYSDGEQKKIEEKKNRERISASGISSDEDLGRYIGYEQGINNYVKLPWNLTMQTNQGGEFTDIGFLFLALIPVIFLFLPFRRKVYPYLILLILLFEILIFVKSDNGLINKSDISGLSNEVIESYIISNNNVFKDKKFNSDIYDIAFYNYVTLADIKTLIKVDINDKNYQKELDSITKQVKRAFYEELKKKVINTSSGPKIAIFNSNLTEKDYKKLLNLKELYISNYKFSPNINSLNNLLEIKGVSESEKNILINLWKDNRSINTYMSDFLTKFNLPLGYSILLIIFLIPTAFFVYLLKNTNRTNIFKLNLIFASFYTFLWSISAFGIVWYGISMYFSFLLMIAIGLYYMGSYNDEDSENEFYLKLVGSLIFALLFLIYTVNSIFPHTFNNIKSASYVEYKLGKITSTQAPFLYHQEYLKILYHLNIASDKREQFLKDNITPDILEIVKGIEKTDIYTVKAVLDKIKLEQQGNKVLFSNANKSINNLYKNIANPPEEYKNTNGIYRIGTFLKYYISDNNRRLLEDSLIFTFNDYIYDRDTNVTVNRMKKLGLEYLLVDLNAATIDKDERRNLTKRYENLLSTFTSDKLELIETDSICLKVALEDYKKSSKTDKDLLEYLYTAGVNYESYSSGVVTNRGVKQLSCYNKILDLVNNDKIDNANYVYLLNLKNYIIKNKKTLADKNQLLNFLRGQITHGYKVLFRIK